MKVKLTVKNKLFIGFGSILLLMITSSAFTFYETTKIEGIETRLLELRFPTVLAGAQLENGINLSLAGLRGYMILGKDPKKAKAMDKVRLDGWNQIDDAMKQMHGFSKHWTNPKNIEKLNEMETYIEGFRKAQQEVKAISHTDDEVPAFKTLLTEAAPRAAKVLSALTSMINEEENLEASPDHKKLLKLLADSRGSFAIGLANIRAYLLSGDNKFRDNFNAKWKLNETSFKQISNMTNIMSSKQHTDWNKYKNVRAEFIEFPPLMFKQRSAPDWNLANHWLGTKAAPKAKAIMGILHEMRINQNKLEEIDKQLLHDEAITMEYTVLVSTLISLIIGIVVSFLIARSIVTPLQRVLHRTKEIANGNLTGDALETTGNDEITELTNAINEMSTNLQTVITQVASSVNELSAASTQLQSTAENTNRGMENQSSETEQVATAMNEMSATVQEVARHASTAATAANVADGAASQGHNLVSGNKDRINKLAERIENASSTINKLGEDTNSVDSIVKVINDIADQTNLLALNAAIEAARAGEQGRGFAVVADEVRTLAARTQESTEEIRTTLDSLKTGANLAVQAMDEGQQQAQESVEQANRVSDSITEISKAVAAISEMNVQIATAAEEQSAVAEEMNRSIIQISSESEVTLQNSHETSSAAIQVGSLSDNLQKVVSHFKV